jgi:hypothetical protein
VGSPELSQIVTGLLFAPARRLRFSHCHLNGTPTFFINGARYDGEFSLKHLLNALTPPNT